MIYLSQKDYLRNTFFLRVIKKNNLKAIEFDKNKPIQFSPNCGGHLPGGEQIDLLEVWVKPVDKSFPSILFSQTPIHAEVSSSTKKVKIKIINTQTNKTQEELDFIYANAPFENRTDEWL